MTYGHTIRAKKFKPINPKKYKGDVTDIVARSSWERKYMQWCDNNPDVIEWGSEVVIVPYMCPVQKRVRRYFVDVYIKVRQKDDTIASFLVEIKPKQYTQPPKKPKRQTKQYIAEVLQWGVNEAKWKAAREFCMDRGWKFIILTEDDLLTKRA